VNLSATGLLAKATDLLESCGYAAPQIETSDWDTATSRLFEDKYGVVGLVVFPTCRELLDSWIDRQQSLVLLMSRFLLTSEGKAWDGYLVLLTPASAPSERSTIEAIRYDTSRVRKLVATGDELSTDADVERVLRPLMPMTPQTGVSDSGSVLELVPRLLTTFSIPDTVSEELVSAFRTRSPLMDAIHKARTGS
jgi:hypothetical protein